MKCPFCNGRGEEIVSDLTWGDQVTPCPDCDGSGEVPADYGRINDNTEDVDKFNEKHGGIW